jgi:hypothetical protein
MKDDWKRVFPFENTFQTNGLLLDLLRRDRPASEVMAILAGKAVS